MAQVVDAMRSHDPDLTTDVHAGVAALEQSGYLDDTGVAPPARLPRARSSATGAMRSFSPSFTSHP
jgi:hypothetical protein